MKVLNFSAIEILPALLDKTKKQTIRPAFCKDCMNPEYFNNLKLKSDKRYQELIRSEHKARFKVGDKVQIMWKQRTSPKDARFWGDTGEILFPLSKTGKYTLDILNATFGKILGQAKITEVFQIEMGKETDDSRWLMQIGNKEAEEVIARKDGFKSYDFMFDWFDKKYKLDDKGKKFWVYRWKWI